jgi:hypothetical protein
MSYFVYCLDDLSNDDLNTTLDADLLIGLLLSKGCIK